MGDSIPIYGPPDEQGCDDLFKHPGLLDFSHTVEPFVVFDLQGLQVTPLPLNHSKLTFGYLLKRRTAGWRGYLTPLACRKNAEIFTQ